MLNPGYEQFGIYPDVGWMATTAAEAFGAGHQFQTNPDLEHFTLERIVDLRRSPRSRSTSCKLMLVGSSKTNVFIDGSDERIDEMVRRLPKYIGRTWATIRVMSLDRDFSSCRNATLNGCDQWIIENMVMDEFIPGQPARMIDTEKASKICSKCENYEFEP